MNKHKVVQQVLTNEIQFHANIKQSPVMRLTFGDEPSGSIKCGEFLNYLQTQLASQEGLCSME